MRAPSHSRKTSSARRSGSASLASRQRRISRSRSAVGYYSHPKVRFALDSALEGAGFEPSVPLAASEGEVERAQARKTLSLTGTEGSNPPPSSGESCANLSERAHGARAAEVAAHFPTERALLQTPGEGSAGGFDTVDSLRVGPASIDAFLLAGSLTCSGIRRIGPSIAKGLA
jgi:hypothetical protein